jgi:tetratricopeptide (TPR) repeat protein
MMLKMEINKVLSWWAMNIKSIYIITCTILAICFALPVMAQKESSYKRYKAKSERSANDVIDEARSIKDENTAEALNKVKEALGLSIAQQDVYNEGRCYVLLGEINEGISEWKLAFENFSQANQKLKPTYSNTQDYRESLRGLGNTSLKLNRYTEALQYFQEALALKSNNTEKMERRLDISEVYYQMGRYDEALSVLEERRKISFSLNETLTSRIQNQKAKIYARTNKVEAAQGLYQNSASSGFMNKEKLSPKIMKEDIASNIKTKEAISDVLVQQQRYDDEIDLRNQSIEYNTQADNFAEVSKDKVELSKALVAKGETTSAIKELEEAALIADTINNPQDQAKAFLSLADLYEKKGRSDRAINAYKKYSSAVDRMEKQNQHRLIEKSDLIKKQKDIEELSKYITIGQRDETIAKETVFRQQLIIYGLLCIILIIAVTSYFIYKNAQASKLANQLLALKSLRSQMNPHFIFNALNSVNHFIAQQDERTANKFLAEFSQLMRLVLENSQEDFISLSKEQEILTLYLKLEHYRFRDKFEYEIIMDEAINTESVMLPPMLIQPYIENAVWHGLRYKDIVGHLTLSFKQEQGQLRVSIIDDGIGRKKSAELKTVNQKKHHSTGLKNIQERLLILNKVYKTNYTIDIEDGGDGTGTHVTLILPITMNH